MAKPFRPTQMVVINTPTSMVSDQDVHYMCAASNALMKEVASSWGYGVPPTVVSFKDLASAGQRPDPNAWNFFMVDEDKNVPGALAYHTEENFKPDGYILTKTIMTNGGVSLYNSANPQAPTVASALFHELAEAYIDPQCNMWWRDPMNGVFISGEVCDPVESGNIIVALNLTAAGLANRVASAAIMRQPATVGLSENSHQVALHVSSCEEVKAESVPEVAVRRPGPVPTPVPVVPVAPKQILVALSDFIFPSWHDAEAPQDGSVKFNFLGTLRAPFVLDHGGYYVKFDPSVDRSPVQVFGRMVPDWKRRLKDESHRAARRGKKMRTESKRARLNSFAV